LLLLAWVLLIVGNLWQAPRRRADIVPVPTGLILDLNTASAASLTLLPGVGPAAAERIVTDRRAQARGRFHSVCDLRRVRGFSDRGVANVEPYVRVGADN
jgi:competence protein ComEA